MKMVYVLAGAVVIAGGAAIFGAQKNTTVAPEKQPASTSGASQQAELDPAGAPDDESSGDVLEGVVLEKIDVPSYTYLRIGPPGSAGQWAAVSTASVEVGKSVRVRGQTVMTNFQSPTLKRTFDSIRFGTLEGPGSSDTAGLPPGHPSTAGSAAPEPEVKVGKVDKATGPNAHRVAEIFAQRKQLAGKSVRVRGVVVKVTNGVMGKNFAHIKDGSGSAAKKDDDIAITSSEPLERGQTVVAEGTLAVDQDLGAGYKYDAILQDAKIEK
jgi:hypothetical protein